MKFRVFWDVLPCSQVDSDRRFRDVYCLHHQGDIPEDSKLLQRLFSSINNKNIMNKEQVKRGKIVFIVCC
jgi:hypothetical protein